MPAYHPRRVFAALSSLLLVLAGGAARATDLVDLYERARENDPAFQVAIQERQIAEQSLRESKAELRPVLGANLETSKTYQNIRSSDNILYVPGTTDYFNGSYRIQLTQPIYRHAAYNGIPKARAEVRQAAGIFAAAEQDLIYRVAEAHFKFLAASADLEFSIAERRAISQQLQASEERLASGLATMVDVHDARARYAIAQATEIDAEDALEESRQAIAEIVGFLPPEIESLSESFPLARPEPLAVEAWVQSAIFQNPQIKAREAAVEIAARDARRERGVRLPAVDFVASAGTNNNGGAEIGGAGGSVITSGNIALRVNVPIYDGGKVAARGAAATMRKKIAGSELERQKRRVERETRAAMQRVLNGVGRIEALEASVLSFEAALSQKVEGLRSGVNTGLQVLDARRDFFRAQRELTQGRYTYILNSLKLKQAAGNLVEDDLGQINVYIH